jgi:RNA polymerase sigma-70 factor (ECF subfamily)
MTAVDRLPLMALPEEASASVLTFHEACGALFEAHFHRLFRFLDRVSGEPDLAQDVAQEAFIRLFRRGSLPDAPEAWLVSVALNLFRNAKSTRRRRLRLLTHDRSEAVLGDPAPAPDEAVLHQESRRRVRSALDRLPDRERHLLLLQAEGYGYRDLAAALELNEASVGTLLVRARRAFRQLYEEGPDASQ